MKRVLVIGSGGTGKSRMTRELGRRLGLEVQGADTVIFLDISRWVCLAGSARRMPRESRLGVSEVGLELSESPESVATMVRGLSYLREVCDYDGRPGVVRVSVSTMGLRIEAWGVRGETRDERKQVLEWEQLNGVGDGRGKIVESLLSLPAGRSNGSRRRP